MAPATFSALPEFFKTAIPEFDEPAPPSLTDSPHERGIAPLERGDAEGAIQAFNEAIEQDPLFPNAYLARAVAHRRLGRYAEAADDERKAEDLGGPEKLTWDRLVNRARHRWHGDFANPEWEQTDPLSREAVLFRTLMRQIHNGGLFQWVANGYDEWIDDLIAAARRVDTAATRDVADLLADLSRELATQPADDRSRFDDTVDENDPARLTQRDELLEKILDYERRYYAVEGQFALDLENWFEEKAGPGEKH